jgi:diguanylate cyclase (GGDEF)-like protein
MSGMHDPVAMLYPIAVLSVGGVLSFVCTSMLALQAWHLVDFRKTLLTMALSLSCACWACFAAIGLLEDPSAATTLLASVPGSLCLLLGSVSLLTLTRLRTPRKTAAALGVLMLAGLAAFPYATLAHHWNAVFQLVCAAVVIGFAATSTDQEAPRLRWLLVGLGAIAALAVIPSVPAALAALLRPTLEPGPLDGPAFRLRALTWTILPVLLYASTMAIINARLAHCLLHAAQIDGLTGLYNRRYMVGMTQRWLASSSSSVAVLMIDIDHFKAINDRFGHAAGDAVLRDTAQLIAASVRSNDAVVARYGGEEFCVVLARAEHRQAVDVAHRLRRAVSEARFTFGGERIGLTVSIGISHGAQAKELSTILKLADQRMYQAKVQGRNRVVAGTTGASSASARASPALPA